MTVLGMRVRRLKKSERLDPERHAWVVEVGMIVNERWRKTQIISRHETEMLASSAMAQLLREGKEKAHGAE